MLGAAIDLAAGAVVCEVWAGAEFAKVAAAAAAAVAAAAAATLQTVASASPAAGASAGCAGVPCSETLANEAAAD